VGFTPQLSIGVWVGMDDPAISLGEKQFGSNAALPIFAQSIKDIYDLEYYYKDADKVMLVNDLDWERPDGVVEKLICSETNKKATEICSQKKEIFLKGKEPVEVCDKHATPLSRFRKD